jgi:hypothetical protein
VIIVNKTSNVKGIGCVRKPMRAGKKTKVKKLNPAKTPTRKIIPVTPSGFRQKDCDVERTELS